MQEEQIQTQIENNSIGKESIIENCKVVVSESLEKWWKSQKFTCDCEEHELFVIIEYTLSIQKLWDFVNKGFIEKINLLPEKRSSEDIKEYQIRPLFHKTIEHHNKELFEKLLSEKLVICYKMDYQFLDADDNEDEDESSVRFHDISINRIEFIHEKEDTEDFYTDVESILWIIRLLRSCPECLVTKDLIEKKTKLFNYRNMRTMNPIPIKNLEKFRAHIFQDLTVFEDEIYTQWKYGIKVDIVFISIEKKERYILTHLNGDRCVKIPEGIISFEPHFLYIQSWIETSDMKEKIEKTYEQLKSIVKFYAFHSIY